MSQESLRPDCAISTIANVAYVIPFLSSLTYQSSSSCNVEVSNNNVNWTILDSAIANETRTILVGAVFLRLSSNAIVIIRRAFAGNRSSGSGTGIGTDRIIGLTIDGGGAPITVGVKGYISSPVAATITKVRLLADVSGSVVVDIWKDTYASYPPVVADTITASAKPTISSALKYEDATLTGWNKTVAIGDVFGFNVDSASTITRLNVELTVS